MKKKTFSLALLLTCASLFSPQVTWSQTPSPSKNWNYFGACYSDDVIYAENGRWWEPRFGLGGGWVYGGTYRSIANGVIEVYRPKVNNSSTYTRRDLRDKKCRRN